MALGGHPTSEAEIVERLRAILADAMARRRDLVAYTKLEAREMDREARSLERAAIERVKAALPDAARDDRLLAVRNRLERMQAQLDEIMAAEVRETSKLLERDDITWRAFEDVASVLGVE